MATIKAMDSGSYKFTVSLGRDVNGKQIRRVMTWPYTKFGKEIDVKCGKD